MMQARCGDIGLQEGIRNLEIVTDVRRPDMNFGWLFDKKNYLCHIGGRPAMVPNDKNVNRAPLRALFLFNGVKYSLRRNQVFIQEIKFAFVKQQNTF